MTSLFNVEMSKGRLVFLESSLNIGGQELQLLQQMRELNLRGWQTRLLCKPKSRIRSVAQEMGLDVELVPFRNALHLPSLIKVRQYLIHLQADAIIVHSGHDSIVGALAAKSLGRRRPMIIRMRTYQPGIPGAFPYCYLFDQTLACSAFLREQILKNRKIPEHKVSVLYPGIDFESLDMRSKEAGVFVALDAWRKAHPGPMMLHGAMLRGEKGHLSILDAMPHILKRHPSLRYVIAGEGPLKEELQLKINAMGLQEHVFLAGMLSPLARALICADLAILPSTSEPLGMFQIEALHLGIPTIAANVGGIPETLRHREDGLLLSAGDSQAWAEGICWALDNHKQMQNWAMHGKIKNQQQFSIDRNIKQLTALIAQFKQGGLK